MTKQKVQVISVLWKDNWQKMQKKKELKYIRGLQREPLFLLYLSMGLFQLVSFTPGATMIQSDIKNFIDCKD